MGISRVPQTVPIIQKDANGKFWTEFYLQGSGESIQLGNLPTINLGSRVDASISNLFRSEFAL